MTVASSPRCERCRDSGEVAISAATGRYRGPGPVPDRARGVVGVDCTYCEDAACPRRDAK